jgi:hypothetical protein
MVPGAEELRSELQRLLPGEELLCIAYGLPAPRGWRAAAQFAVALADAVSGSRTEIDSGYAIALTPSGVIVVRASRNAPYLGTPRWEIGDPVRKFSHVDLGTIEVEASSTERTVLVIPLPEERIRLAVGVTPTHLPDNAAQARAIADAIRARS